MPYERPPAHRPDPPTAGVFGADQEPRTVAGRAAVSALRPHLRRAIGRTIAAIEGEAAEPYRRALAELETLLDRLAALDPASDWDDAARTELVEAARAARRRLAELRSTAGRLQEPGPA
ncbi:MAG TPA: hypothetical protein VNO86_10515 [Candidatus Binatia bacterium]|nr:hypothetical protein [Candidatus Binatia bacterium]